MEGNNPQQNQGQDPAQFNQGGQPPQGNQEGGQQPNQPEGQGVSQQSLEGNQVQGQNQGEGQQQFNEFDIFAESEEEMNQGNDLGRQQNQDNQNNVNQAEGSNGEGSSQGEEGNNGQQPPTNDVNATAQQPNSSNSQDRAMQQKVRNLEFDNFLNSQDGEIYKPFADKVRPFINHPKMQGLNFKGIANAVIGPREFMRMGAEQARRQMQQGQSMQPAGQIQQQSGEQRSYMDMSTEEFMKERERVYGSN